MIGGFEFTVGLFGRVGFVMKGAVGEGAAEALVEEEEQKGRVNAFGCEPIGIASSIALE